ncbi:MAG: hypothetical protein CME36_09580 [unclassified Hahellaceae]|nr:hypothetical protein [Hahellaceae bacterium]|tara:strand:+ start:22040 stop:23461 length:1422 start_codon:yes stop_codon:yes gene_type:complete
MQAAAAEQPLSIDLDGRSVQLTEDQSAAFKTMCAFVQDKLEEEVMTLVGYAGTGKTTLMNLLVCFARDEGLKVAVAAPTNKAVGVLKEKIGADVGASFGSIHSFLGLRMKELEDGSQDCKREAESTVHEYDLLIVDECSMINKEIFGYTVNSRRNCKVLFVGDSAQLPPVGESQKSRVFDVVQLKLVLSRVVRQAAENPIIALSMRIRQEIEKNQPVTPQIMNDSLPPPEAGVTACVTHGGAQTLIAWAVDEQRSGRDARVLAYTNLKVQHFNRNIHEALHGIHGGCIFAVGERVIAHQAFEAICESGLKADIFTSEELKLEAILEERHPRYSEIAAYKLSLRRDTGALVTAYFPADAGEAEALVAAYFKTWRQYKAEAEALTRAGDGKAPLIEVKAKQASNQAWALRKAFAPLRHCYALTTHKSQGSTFDTALVDYNDLAKMLQRSTNGPFDFNRALYVAVTRPRSFLAVVL